jgi:O-antigen/teichoic acid export membrane protein
VLKKFIKDMAIYAPSQFLPALTAFITTPILTRLFPPAEYGYWALAANLSAFLVALAVSGYGSAVIRYYPIYKAKSTLNIFLATLVSSIVVTILVIGVLSTIGILLFKEYLPINLIHLFPIILLIFISQSIFSVFIAALRAQARSGYFTSFQLMTNYGGLALGLLLVLVFGLRVEGLLWGSFIAVIISLPLLIFQVTKGIGIKPKFINLVEAKQLWLFAWPLMIGNVAMWGLRVSDLYIIGLFRPEQEVGIYSVSYNISAKSIEILVALFLLSVSPLVFRTWENEGREATEKILTMVTRVYLVFCLPAAIGLTVLAFPFVALLTSPEYYEGSKIVGFVVFSSVAWGLANIAMMGITIKKKALQIGTNQIIAAAAHIGLQMLLVPKYGYFAAAVSTLIGYSLLFALQTISSRPFLTWKFPFRTLFNVFVASLVMALTIYGIYLLVGLENGKSIAYLFISILVAIPVYVGCLWMIGEAKEEEKKAIFRIWNQVIGRKG